MADERLVVVAGAGGRTGRCVVQELLKRGYRVRAISRQAPKQAQPGVEYVQADLSSVASLEKAMEGAQFAISAIGSKKPLSAAENDKVDNMGNQNLARAVKCTGLKQIVVISSIGTGNSRDAVFWLFRWLMTSALRAKEKSEAFIKSCGINYTIIRPGGLTDKELPNEVALGVGGMINGIVRREQVARVCVDALENTAMLNRTFEVVARASVKEGTEQFIVKL
jgi:uncharacterized protein YbjT (DUF2867 family)